MKFERENLKSNVSAVELQHVGRLSRPEETMRIRHIMMIFKNGRIRTTIAPVTSILMTIMLFSIKPQIVNTSLHLRFVITVRRNKY